MKTSIMRCLSMAFVLAAFSINAQGQKFLKNVDKAVNKATTTVSKVSDVAETLSEATTTAESCADSTTMALLKDPQFTVIPTYQTDEKGDTIRNEDGTKQLRYIVYDGDGKACSVTFAKELISARTKQYGKIIKKTATGTLTGVAGGLLAGGGKKKIIAGAATGAATGLLSSTDNMDQIRKINKNMKQYEKVIEAYQQTFTEEGLPIDANADLTNVNGIDFTKNEAITKSSAEIAEELANSNNSIGSLEDINIDSLLQ